MNSLELELEVKVKKFPESEEELKEYDTDRIIGKDTLLSTNLNDDSKFEYRRIVVKLDQLEGRGDFDGIHTVIYLPYGVFLARIPFDRFNYIYEVMTGMNIKKVTDFRFVEEGTLPKIKKLTKE